MLNIKLKLLHKPNSQKLTHNQDKVHLTKMDPEMIEMLNLCNKNAKRAIIVI